MTTTPVHDHHCIDYVEIYVTDMLRAKAFYAAAFGWSYNDYSPGYAGIVRGAGESGGLCLIDDIKLVPKHKQDGVPVAGPLIVLYSDSIDDSLVAVKKAGGKITKEIFEFPGGKRFQFLDPSGNTLAVWTTSV